MFCFCTWYVYIYLNLTSVHLGNTFLSQYNYLHGNKMYILIKQ